MKTKKMNKLLGLLLSVAVLAALAIAIGLGASAATIPASGYTVNDVTNTYTVYTAEGLLAWNTAATNALIDNSDATKAPNLTLAADITLPPVASGNSNWTPVGTSPSGIECPYDGTIDGAGHTISGLTIDHLADSEGTIYYGFVSTLTGTIKNLTFTNVKITGKVTVGVVAGKVGHAVTLENETSLTYIGGTIENCHVLSGSVHGRYYVGGIAGTLSNHNSRIIACSNAADITADSYSSSSNTHDMSYVGGITGFQQGGKIVGCYNSGRVSGKGGSVGGITGYAFTIHNDHAAYIVGCYNIGPIEMDTETHANYKDIGAILGTVSNSMDKTTATDNYYILPDFTATLGYTAATNGIGSLSDEVNTEQLQSTLIDGSTVTWNTALAAMNDAIAEKEYEWKYYANESADRDARPLVICTADHPKWSNGACEICGFACDHADCTLSYQNLDDGTHVEIYDICGGWYGEPHPHSTDAVNDRAATCTSPAYCSYCNSEYGATNPDNHSMADATCTAPKTCDLCGATEGEALGHSWTAADCVTPKTCTACNATEGAALGHSWKAADCVTAKTCTTCNATEGTALGHKYDNNCDADCNVCKETRTPAAHVDENEDHICDQCGAELPKEGLPVGAVVGIVIGSVAVAGGLGALLAFLLLKKKKKDSGEAQAHEQTAEAPQDNAQE